jgi:hypothetical protein
MNEDDFDDKEINPWIPISLEDVKYYKNGEWEIFYRPEGEDCAKIRRVK